MVPFRLPKGKRAKVNRTLQRKETVVRDASTRMEKTMRAAINQIAEHYQRTGRYADPDLSQMETDGEMFYRAVVTAAFLDAEDLKGRKPGKKRLSKLPFGIPNSLRSLEQIFRDSRYWPKVLKRNKLLTDKLRKAYLAKLRKKFQTVVPMLTQGFMSVEDVKEKLQEEWQTSRARVETIFRTETTTYFTKTQIAYFKGDDAILGFIFDSIIDKARTPICKSRHGLVYRPDSPLLQKNQPPCHFNCRSHLIPLANTPANRKMLEDPQRDPTIRKVIPLPPGWRN